MIKRLLVLFISICIVCGAGGVLASPAYSDVEETSSSAEAIYLLAELEIMQGRENNEFAPDECITRAEFAKIAAVLCGIDNSYAEDYDAFADVDSEHWAAGYINAVAALGYICGNSNGYFEPENNITAEQMIKILVCVLGYEPFAELNGGYPAGYMSVARDNKLLSGFSGKTNEEIKRKDAALLIYNALCTPVLQVKYENGMSYYKNDKYTLMYMRFGVSQIKNTVIYADNYTTLSEARNSRFIIADGEEYLDTEFKTGGMLGYSTNIYYKENRNGENEIVYAVKTQKNNTYTVKSDDFISVDSGKFRYLTDDDKHESINLSGSADVIYNGKAAEYNKDIFSIENGEFVFIDNNNDDVADVIVIKQFQNMTVSAVDYDNKRLYDKYISGKYLDLKDMNENQLKVFADGEEAVFDDLSEENLISYYMSYDNDYCEIYVCNNQITGRVDGINDEKIVIGNEKYEQSAYLDYRSEKICVGDEGTFSLDISGKIADFEIDGDGGMQYGYIIDISSGEMGGQYQIQLLNENGIAEIYNISSKWTIDGKNVSSDNSVYGVEAMLMIQGVPKRQIIKYRVANGEIKEVDTVNVLNEGEARSLKEEASKSLRKYKYYAKSFLLEFNISEGTKIFRVPNEETNSEAELRNANNYDCVTTDNFVHDRDYIVAGYDFKDGNIAGAIVVYTDGVEEISAVSTLALVNKVSVTLNDEGEMTYSLNCLADGKYVDYVAKTAEVFKPAALGRLIRRGDIILLATDKNGYVNNISVEFDVLKLNKNEKKYSGSFMTNMYEFCGLVRGKGNGYFVVDTQRLYNSNVENITLAPIASGNIYIYDTELDIVKKGTVNDIICGDTPETASYVFVKMSYESCKDIVIYK